MHFPVSKQNYWGVHEVLLVPLDNFRRQDNGMSGEWLQSISHHTGCHIAQHSPEIQYKIIMDIKQNDE